MISDSVLRRATIAAVSAIAAWFVARSWLAEAWRTPGSPELYIAGVLGALLLLVPAVFALAKRSGASSAPVAWFNAHVACSLAGAVLIAAHSGGFLRRRLRGARLMAATFASKQPSFRVPDAATRERLRILIEEKRRLLAELDPAADEGTFSVTLAHLLRKPGKAMAYGRLARAETRLLGTRAAVAPAQAWWRPLDLALAWIFVFGVLVHVITVTFFAGYVADGGPVTWWHLRK